MIQQGHHFPLSAGVTFFTMPENCYNFLVNGGVTESAVTAEANDNRKKKKKRSADPMDLLDGFEFNIETLNCANFTADYGEYEALLNLYFKQSNPPDGCKKYLNFNAIHTIVCNTESSLQNSWGK